MLNAMKLEYQLIRISRHYLQQLSLQMSVSSFASTGLNSEYVEVLVHTVVTYNGTVVS